MRKLFILFTALFLVVASPLLAEDNIAVDRIVVSPSLILTEEEIDTVIELCSEEFSGVQLLNAVVDILNQLYLEKGYPNAIAYIPEQTFEDGVVRIELLEGKVGNITVKGNGFTSEKYILDYLEMEKGEILNLDKFEKKLISFNRWNSGASISSELNPGEETGTTDITINTEEEFPMRAFFTFDNYASQALEKVRYGAHVSSANITHLRETLSAGVYFSKHLITPYADASIGLGTRLRLGANFSYGTTHAEAIKEASIDFGSKSLSNGIYGTYALFRNDRAHLGLNVSFDYSRSTSELMDVTVLTEHKYYALRTGFSFIFAGDRFLLSTSNAVSGTREESEDHIYYKFSGSSQISYRFSDIIHLVVNSVYQVMPFDMYVPDTEKIYIGGASTVRAYSEGNTIWGKDGYTLCTEFRFFDPANRNSYFFLFADHGGVFSYPDTGENFLFSFGGGLVLTKGNWLTINFAAGMNGIPVTQDVDHHVVRAHIGVTINTP